jgi:hypothetical protein
MPPNASLSSDGLHSRAEALERRMADLAQDCARLGRWPVAAADAPALHAALDALARCSDDLGQLLHRHMTGPAAPPAVAQYFMEVIQRRKRLSGLVALYRRLPQPGRRPLYTRCPPAR